MNNFITNISLGTSVSVGNAKGIIRAISCSETGTLCAWIQSEDGSICCMSLHLCKLEKRIATPMPLDTTYG